jgi:electron transfer flavoprotein beta subunit
MHIVVCMKQVVDLEKIRIKATTREPVLGGLPVLFGDFDKNALEEAVRIAERRDDVRITAVAVGSAKLKNTIKQALAIGADEAVLLIDPLFAGSDAMGSARALARVMEKLDGPDLILMGEGSTDDYSGQVPPRVAELLGLPQVTYVRKLEVEADALHAVRDLEDALEEVEAPLPAVVSVTGEINTPRLPPLTAILKAARKPVHVWGPEDIGVTEAEVGAAASTVEELSNLAPEQSRKQEIFEGDLDETVDALVKALEHEGVLA